jgi:hypothetical protein
MRTTAAAHEPALMRALDTYLRFRRRPHDAGALPAPPSADSDALARRVFMLLLRLCVCAACVLRARAHVRALRQLWVRMC